MCVQVLREGMGQAANPVMTEVLETVITNALIIDYTGQCCCCCYSLVSIAS
jgi:urease alpha subunit